ncbi:hypothetical protein DL89DRAFT_39264 [Linderina pennispora]|uniref:Uncharacterized protein n=1 Tax=Linderina pennispora TaxID=61395 RepID=A0A1Y1W360_9FUNG|nr:uncharacterized protein DL89DRAFT_39264 [Linderina pennispora]ORX67961.1 hypothetical protein DL89DRAFT_39264 [Linderina pennispora]
MSVEDIAQPLPSAFDTSIVRRVVQHTLDHTCTIEDVLRGHNCPEQTLRNLWKLRTVSPQFYKTCTDLYFRFITTSYPLTADPHILGTHPLKRTMDLHHHHKMHVFSLRLMPHVTEIQKAMLEIIKVMYPMISLFPRLGEVLAGGDFWPAVRETEQRPALPCIVCPAVKYVVMSFDWDSVLHPSVQDEVDDKVSALFAIMRSCFPNARLHLQIDDSDEYLEDSAKMLLVRSIFSCWGRGHSLMHISRKLKPWVVFPAALTGLTKLHAHAHPLTDHYFYAMHRSADSLTDLSLSGLYPADLLRVVHLSNGERVDYLLLRRLVVSFISLKGNEFPDELAFAEHFPNAAYMKVMSSGWPIPGYLVGAASKGLRDLVIEYPRPTNLFRNPAGGIMAAYHQCPALENITIRQYMATMQADSKFMYPSIVENLFRYPKSARSFRLCSDHIVGVYETNRCISAFLNAPKLQSIYIPEVALSIGSVFTLISGLTSLHELTVRFALPVSSITKMVTAKQTREMADMCRDCCAPLKRLTLTNNHFKQKRLLFSYVAMIAAVTGTLNQATVHVTSKSDDIMDVFLSEARRKIFRKYRSNIGETLVLHMGDIQAFSYPVDASLEPRF